MQQVQQLQQQPGIVRNLSGSSFRNHSCPQEALTQEQLEQALQEAATNAQQGGKQGKEIQITLESAEGQADKKVQADPRCAVQAMCRVVGMVGWQPAVPAFGAPSSRRRAWASAHLPFSAVDRTQYCPSLPPPINSDPAYEKAVQQAAESIIKDWEQEMEQASLSVGTRLRRFKACTRLPLPARSTCCTAHHPVQKNKLHTRPSPQTTPKVMDNLEKAQLAFDDLAELLEGEEGFALSKGVWQSSGWRELDDLRKWEGAFDGLLLFARSRGAVWALAANVCWRGVSGQRRPLSAAALWTPTLAPPGPQEAGKPAGAAGAGQVAGPRRRQGPAAARP